MCQIIIILLSELWYIGQIHAIPKYIKKEIEIIYDILWNGKKTGPPRQLSYLYPFRGLEVVRLA